MKCLPLAFTLLTLMTRVALAADSAELSLYLFDQNTPLVNAEVRIDDTARGHTSADGVLVLTLEPGKHELSIVRDHAEVLKLELELQSEENAELIATLYPDAAPSVFIESSHQDGSAASAQATQAAAGPPGTLAGRVLNSENGQPIANARVYVAGTPLDVVTDAEGQFSVPVSAGTYPISVIATEFSSQTIDGIVIAAEATTERAIELTPSGVELPEFVVLEPFVEGSLAAFVEEKRTSSAVTDILGAEQIARAGDSDAAGALKRVTGLTLVDGKFVYVRGLGERYSSVLLNGAQIPSPDPTRRVVPLDLFPTDILNGIVVQKTYSADMPGEFGGGTIQMRTRGVPESFLLRASTSVGYADGSTGEEGLRSRGGGGDWTGFDDGFRAAPEGLFERPFPGRGTPQLSALGIGLTAKGFGVGRKDVGPNTGFSFSIGDNYAFSDGDFQLGFIGALRYSQNWDVREEDRAEFSVRPDGSLVKQQEYSREQTERAIDASGFFAVGAKIAEHHELSVSTLLLRQTNQEDRIDEGVKGGGSLSRDFSLEWIENELHTHQLTGKHSLPALANLLLDWQYTTSSAQREVPFARAYRYIDQPTLGGFIFEMSPTQVRYEFLEDAADEAQLQTTLPLSFGEARGLTLMAGGSQLKRERVSDIFRFGFRNRVSLPREPTPIENILHPDNVESGALEVTSQSRATDFYTAEQSLDAYFVSGDLTWGDWRANLGVREESNAQRVITQDPFVPNAQPVIGLIERADRLPSGAITWAYNEAAQLRLGYSETVSRPDFRELSRAPFTDPLLDISVIGNPELQQADIASYDLRWEYYFNAVESFSVALFRKEFTHPIELVRTPASGDLLELRNAESAQNQGVEFDLYRSFGFLESLEWLPAPMRHALPWSSIFVGANYAWIDSEIDLGSNVGIQTSAQRPLQGQSPYVGNLSLSYLPEHGKVEATLLYNVFGERISKVGESGVADEYEQSFHQLDFTLGAELPWDGWKLKLRLRNLLDPKVEFTQGDQVSRAFRKGREAAISLEWRY